MKYAWFSIILAVLAGCGGESKNVDVNRASSAQAAFSSTANTNASTSSSNSSSDRSSNAYRSSSSSSLASSIETSSQSSSEDTRQTVMLYDGDTVMYNRGEAWDANSDINEASYSPFSGTQHIRANIVTANGWGAVVYYFNTADMKDWSDARQLTLQAQSDMTASISLGLVYTNGNKYAYGTSAATLTLSESYKAFNIDVPAIASQVDLTQVAGIILYSSSGTLTIDLDDIAVAFSTSPSTPDTGTDDKTDTVAIGSSTEVHFFGRFDTRDPGTPKCAWTNCGVGVRFEGDALDIQLSGAGRISFQIMLDGEYHKTITTDGAAWSNSTTKTTYRIVDTAGPGEHNVQMYRNAEASFGAISFHDITVTNGKLAQSSFPFDKKIEIIGDSISAGYGNAGCPWGPDNEKGSSAWGPLAARKLGAVAHIIAVSGIGMVTSYSGATEDQMPERYSYALPADKQSQWQYSQYIPDVVVINLGTNDFSSYHNGMDRNTYIYTYQEFVHRLRSYYPDAYILLATNTANDSFSDELDEIISGLSDNNIEKINLKTSNWNGCDGHPDLNAHQTMADTLVAHIKAVLGW